MFVRMPWDWHVLHSPSIFTLWSMFWGILLMQTPCRVTTASLFLWAWHALWAFPCACTDMNIIGLLYWQWTYTGLMVCLVWVHTCFSIHDGCYLIFWLVCIYHACMLGQLFHINIFKLRSFGWKKGFINLVSCCKRFFFLKSKFVFNVQVFFLFPLVTRLD